MKPESTRTEVLRDILVERVEHSSQPRAVRRPGVVALVAAFAAGALLTGGALSASALVTAQKYHYDTAISAAAGGRSYMGAHDQLVGEPFEVLSDGESVLTLGRQPAGATALVVAASCVGGKIGIAVDGDLNFWLTCDAEGGGGASYEQTSSLLDSHQIAVDIEWGSVEYSVWAAWVVKQEEPPQSDAQVAALSDGVVTYDEYRAGFDRYSACMLEAGFEVGGIVDVEDERLMHYTLPAEAVDSGADMACYVAEFGELDSTWQVAVEAQQ